MYIYPENLKAKPMLWLWLLRDIAIIGVAALISVLSLVQGVGMAPLVVTVLYQTRLEEETTPKIRELLQKDISYLDEIQTTSASSREFVLVLRMEEQAALDEGGLRQKEKSLCDHGISVRLAEEQDVKRLLVSYYLHDADPESLEDVDGERVVFHG